jgi:hypothetical protein
LESLTIQKLSSNAVVAEADVDASHTGGHGTPEKATPKNSPEVDAERLARIHGRLVEIVAPATPRTVLLLASETAKKRVWKFLGPVPLIRRMLVVAVVFLITLIVVSLSHFVDGNPNNFSFVHNSGISLLVNELFLLSAATIGACFSGLFQASRYVREGTFDPTYESSYWIRFILGLMACAIIVSLIDIETYIPGEDQSRPSASMGGIGKPTLALLGGFSAAVVHRILQRLVTAVESLVRGDVQTMIAAQKHAAKTLLTEKTGQMRLQLSARLTKLQQQISADANPDELKEELNRIQNELISSGIAGVEDEAVTPVKRKESSTDKVSPDSQKI